MKPVPVSMDPEMIKVAASGGTSSFRMLNDSERRYSFKIKSTNNDHYRVSTVYGFIENGGTTSVEVTRLEGPPKSDDRLEVLFMIVEPECKDARAPFSTGEPPEFSINLPLIAE